MALQIQWVWEIAIYLFLGGLASGSLLAAAVVNLIAKDRYKNNIRFGAWVGTILLAIGVLFLLVDVGVPTRAIILYKSFVNLNSWMAFGAWFLFGGIIVYGIYALSYTDWVTKKLKFLLNCRTVLSIIIVPLSIGIAVYTGLLLSVLYAHPLWNTWFLPALFTVSALDTGVALFIAYSVLSANKAKTDSAKLEHVLEWSTVILIGLEVIVLASYLSIVSSALEIGFISVQILTSGSLSQIFWIIFVGCGLAVPLFISISLLVRRDLTLKTWGILPMIGVAGCLAGGFTLRFVVLLAGLPL